MWGDGRCSGKDGDRCHDGGSGHSPLTPLSYHVIGVALSSNTRLLDAPGNVLLQAASTGLPKDSVANVTQLLTIDEDYLTDRAGRVSRRLMRHVERGLRLVLGLWPD